MFCPARVRGLRLGNGQQLCRPSDGLVRGGLGLSTDRFGPVTGNVDGSEVTLRIALEAVQPAAHTVGREIDEDVILVLESGFGGNACPFPSGGGSYACTK